MLLAYLCLATNEEMDTYNIVVPLKPIIVVSMFFHSF